MILLTTLLVLLGGVPAPPPAADTKAEAAEAGVESAKLVGEFAARPEASSAKSLKLVAEPVLLWTNHLGRRYYGGVYVWTHEGRPEIVASVNTVFTDRRMIETEFQSLSEGRPVLTHQGKLAWEPSESGLVFKPLPDAPKPGATASARLQQMRLLAGQFAVVADSGRDKEIKEDLRLLRAPIYRYEGAAQGVADGGLFAFTKGTDPDAVLLIEARGKGDDARWHYAFARMNGYCGLRGTCKDNEVWQVKRQSNAVNTDPKQPYFVLRK